nr:zonadhesin-like protein 5B [Plectrocnemia conspersa]
MIGLVTFLWVFASAIYLAEASSSSHEHSPKKCYPNATWKLSDGCENTCSMPQFKAVCNGKPACKKLVCDDGTLKDCDGQCVAPINCKEGCGGDKNAYWTPCGKYLCSTYCAGITVPAPCLTAANAVCPDTGCLKGGCICKPGFSKNYKKKCVVTENCNKCCEYETYGTAAPCAEKTCSNVLSTAPCTATAVPGCWCNAGFVRNCKGQCVPFSTCPKRTCPTDPRATVALCPVTCPATCQYPAAASCYCTAGSYACICNCGHSYNTGLGKCVKKDQCPTSEDSTLFIT